MDDEWMQAHSTHLRNNIEDFKAYEDKCAKEVLLNCGILGGKVELVIDFLEKLCHLHKTYNRNNKTAYTGDMGAFNYIMRTVYNAQLMQGASSSDVYYFLVIKSIHFTDDGMCAQTIDAAINLAHN